MSPTSDTRHESKPDVAYNIFRDSPLRYCGYANEVGESFRYQYPRLVVPSYLVAFGYCLADAMSTGNRVMSEDGNIKTAEESRSKNVQACISAIDTLLWQGLASVAIPGAVINFIVHSSRIAVARTTGLPLYLSTWLPTAVGLSSIPIIIHPIDYAVDFLLDNTTRKILHVRGSNS